VPAPTFPAKSRPLPLPWTSMGSGMIRALAALAVAVTLLAASAVGAPTRQQIFAAFADGDYENAATLIEAYLADRPPDANMLYNLACARSRLGQREAATDALFRAVKAGFRDFRHMERDPDLDAIRGEPMYGAILEAAQQVSRDDRRRREPANIDPEASLDRWRERFTDDAYRFEVDETHRIAFVTALDATSHREMREMLESQADQLIDSLFGGAPPYYVLIAIPTPDDADDIFNGDRQIGGRYDHRKRELIARDIGGSLRHEFVHAMHYGHMERLGLRSSHGLWIQEGIASLYEHYELSEDGSIRFLPNERTNIANRAARAGALPKWETLFDMTGDRFMKEAARLYPVVRSIFEFLAERDALATWYGIYVDRYDDDDTGELAFEIVFGKPLEEIEAEWRTWLRKRPMVDQHIAYGDASLGIRARINGTNDGVHVEYVMAGSAARQAGLRAGDVIVSIDDQSTRSYPELQRIIGARSIGDVVSVRYRRGDRYQTVEAELRAMRGPRLVR